MEATKPKKKKNSYISLILILLLVAWVWSLGIKKIEPYGIVTQFRYTKTGCECLIEWPAHRVKQHTFMYWQPCNGLQIGDTIKTMSNEQ